MYYIQLVKMVNGVYFSVLGRNRCHIPF